MVKRVCRDCPIAGCGAKYLVKLSNHLADVHELDHMERRKYLQEAKLQPRVKVVLYLETRPSPSKPSQTDIFYQPSIPRNPKKVQKNKPRNVQKGVRKVRKPAAS